MIEIGRFKLIDYAMGLWDGISSKRLECEDFAATMSRFFLSRINEYQLRDLLTSYITWFWNTLSSLFDEQETWLKIILVLISTRYIFMVLKWTVSGMGLVLIWHYYLFCH